MNKFKKILLGTLSVLTLGLFVATGARVDAATGSYVDKTYDSTASNTDWTYSDVSGSTSFDSDHNSMSTGAVTVGALPKNKSITSPTFAAASSAVVTIYCGTSSTKNGAPFEIRAYNGNDLVATVTGYTHKDKYLAQACTDTSNTTGTFTLTTTESFNKIAIYNSNSKGAISFASISYITTDYVSKTIGTISAVNSTQYTLGDSYNENGFTVTAHFTDESSGTLAPNKYSVSIADVTTFSSVGEYTATITLVADSSITTTCTVNVIKLKTYLNSSNMTTRAGGSVTRFGNSIFNLIDSGTENMKVDASAVTLPDGTTSVNRINKGSSGANALIEFVAPHDGYVTIWAALGTSSANDLYVCKDSYSTSTYAAKYSATTQNEMFVLRAEIVEGEKYVIGGGARFYIYGVFTELADSTSITLNKQFNDDDNPEYLRFIGKIQGIAPADYANISSVLMEFDFNGHKEAYCYNLYKSVVALDETLFTSGTFKMYTVLTLSNVGSYTGKNMTFENIKMTVTFSDGSTKEATHNDIALA